MASLNVSRLVAGASTNATLVKAAPGTVNGWSFQNAAAYAVYFKLYNSATIPTAGSGTPVLTIGIPAAGNVDQYLGDDDEGGAIYFNAGIGFTITKLAADADTTVLVVADSVTNLWFK